MKETDSIVYTEIELDAMRKTKALLLSQEFCKKQKRDKAFSENEVSKRHLAITVIICKCRPEEAAIKYIQWLNTLTASWGIDQFNDEQLSNPPKGSDHYLRSYNLAGRDINGTNIFWIGSKVPIPNDLEEERLSIYAGIRFHFAIHSDAKTIREGITFVLDVSNNRVEKVGNEKRLQGSHNTYPLRPKHIFIVGASKVVRVSINALLKLGSFVSKAKILKRVRFVTLDQVVDTEKGGTVPKDSLPEYLKDRTLDTMMKNLDVNGKKEDEIELANDHNAVVEWVNERIAKIPVPDI